MTLNEALKFIRQNAGAIGRAAGYQNAAALEVQTACALFQQRPQDNARRLIQAADAWREYAKSRSDI